MKTLITALKVIAKVILFGKKAFLENNWQEICRG